MKTSEQKFTSKEILDDLLQKSKAVKEKAKEAAQKLDELKTKSDELIHPEETSPSF